MSRPLNAVLNWCWNAFVHLTVEQTGVKSAEFVCVNWANLPGGVAADRNSKASSELWSTKPHCVFLSCSKHTIGMCGITVILEEPKAIMKLLPYGFSWMIVIKPWQVEFGLVEMLSCVSCNSWSSCINWSWTCHQCLFFSVLCWLVNLRNFCVLLLLLCVSLSLGPLGNPEFDDRIRQLQDMGIDKVMHKRNSLPKSVQDH